MRVGIVLGLALLVLVAQPVLASPNVTVVGTWSLDPQSRDRNGDGFIDGDGGVPSAGALSANPSTKYVGAGNGIAQPDERLIDGVLSWYLPTQGLTMRLNACKSRGRTYTWTIRSADQVVERTPERPLTQKKCRTNVTLPEGQYTLVLTIRGSGRTARANIPAQVRNRVIVSLGDSYASGEGNPRNVEAWLRERSPLAAFRPYWDDDTCRRSTRAAPAQAALRLEQNDPKSTVTFLHLACSGATIQRGILGAQGRGIPAQVDAMQSILGQTKVDAIIVSIGGNDIGFGSILQSCLLNNNCPLTRATGGPLAGFPTIQDGIQQRLAQLRADFTALRDRLAQIAPSTPVYITMYPDLTRNANGAPCTYFGMSPRDFAWARDTMLVPSPAPNYTYTTTQGAPVVFALNNGSLNGQIAATADLGFQPVVGSWSASGESSVGHGICAGGESWTIGVSLGGNASGAFHPNPRGQSVIAEALVLALQRQ